MCAINAIICLLESDAPTQLDHAAVVFALGGVNETLVDNQTYFFPFIIALLVLTRFCKYDRRLATRRP